MTKGQNEPMNGHEDKHDSAVTGRHPDAAAIYQQVDKIVSDPLFSTSKRFTSLLRFIVERTVEGQHDSLKERIIGIEIFGRTPDYDTSVDASVRVAVTELRKRLHSYYQTPERKHELHIEIPTRSYVAEFTLPEQSPRKQRLKRWLTRRNLGIVLAAAAVLAVALSWGVNRHFANIPATDKFWAPLLSNSNRVMIAVGTPPQERQMRVSSAGSLADVSPGMSLNQIVALQPVFPFNDVVAANSACSFLGLHGKECVTRLDQSIVPAELRTAPLVVIGGIRNDWAVRLGVNLRYKLAHEPGGGVNFIEDSSNPANHSWAVDMTAPIKHDQVIADYALINRVLDPSTGQWWVGVAGITGLGTLAAEQVLVDPKTMSALSANFPRGWERKNLQIVLEVKILRGIASDYRPVAVYAW